MAKHSQNQCYVIAEIGVNHNGDMDIARKLIDVAAGAGAHAVKFQTFFADELVSRNAEQADYQKRNMGRVSSQFDMLKQLELDDASWGMLYKYCQDAGIDFLSTPFSERAADLLEATGVHAYKTSSGDLTHLPLLRHIAKKQKPMIISTGMATLAEIEDAVKAVNEEDNQQISLLHCVSNYPAAPEDCNLAAMETMRRAFGYPVGWSDHTMGAAITLAAVALGATLIEKHITLDQAMEGPDHKASMAPDDFATMMADILAIEAAMGNGIKRPSEAEVKTAKVGRRSIVAAKSIAKGKIIVAEDLKITRPGSGLKPKYLNFVVGARASCDIEQDMPIALEQIVEK